MHAVQALLAFKMNLLSDKAELAQAASQFTKHLLATGFMAWRVYAKRKLEKQQKLVKAVKHSKQMLSKQVLFCWRAATSPAAHKSVSTCKAMAVIIMAIGIRRSRLVHKNMQLLRPELQQLHLLMHKEKT